MKKARYKSGLVLLFLILSLIPPVSGGWPSEQTRHIIAHPSGYDGDMFVTQAGIGHHGPLVTVLDPNMDIYGYLFFKNMMINTYFHLENATLRLHTASTMDFDNESTFTIYGIPDYRLFGMGEWGYGSPGEIMTAPKTSAYVSYNSSQFYGHQWWEIDVTNIVQELKSNPYYEGPGMDFNDPGDYMAFIILGAGGHDTRYFYDLSAGNGLEAQLHLHWDFSPPPPDGYDDAEWVEDYGDYTIWFNPLDLNLSYAWQYKRYAPFQLLFDVIEDTEPVLISVIGDIALPTTDRILSMTSDGTLHVVWTNKTSALYKALYAKSLDRGETWIAVTDLGIGPGMDTRSQHVNSIAVDSNDVLHVLFHSTATDYPDTSQIWITNYTDSWSMPFRISTGLDQELYGHGSASIALDEEDNLHVVWQGKGHDHPTYSQIYYTNRTSGWSGPIRISNRTNMAGDYQRYPNIAIDNQSNPHVVWQGEASEFSSNPQIVYTNYTSSDGWLNPMRISNATGMITYSQGESSIAINSQNDIEVVWSGVAPGYTNNMVWYAVENGTWQIPIEISTFTGMGVSLNNENTPSITVDSEDTTHVIWSGTATGFLWTGIWYAHKHSSDSWVYPELIQYTANQYSIIPHFMWSMWPGLGAIGTYIVTDENGTIVQDDLDSLDDAYDWIDEEDTDPEDPDPAGAWSEGPGGETGAFTRFRMRLWFLIIGFGCLFGPVLFFAWRKPSGYYIICGAIVMLIGIGLLMSIAQV